MEHPKLRSSLDHLWALIFVIVVASLPAQQQHGKRPKESWARSFAPIDLPVLSYQPAPDEIEGPPPTVFVLKTSWIPGETGKGSLRYQLEAYGRSIKPDTLFNVRYVRRLNDCIFALELFDVDRFLLRRVAVSFKINVSESAKPLGLTANDAVPMSLAEDKSVAHDGSFNMSWTCPEE